MDSLIYFKIACVFFMVCVFTGQVIFWYGYWRNGQKMIDFMKEINQELRQELEDRKSMRREFKG